MSVVERQEEIRAMRGPMRSPGRPSKAQREDRVRFWEGIAGGVSIEDAAAGAGVSPAVGSRWFRQAGAPKPYATPSLRRSSPCPNSSAAPWPGTKESKWPNTLNSAQTPTSTSTSATPKVPGNAAPTRTPTVSSANTSPKAPTSTDTQEATSTLSQQPSTADPAKPSAGRPPRRPSTNTYTPSNKAVLQRPLEPGQYLSIRYTNRLTEAGIEPSVGSVGDSYDNALAESVIGLYKTELIHKRAPWKDLDHLEYATLEYVDWFNHRRLLEPIGDIPPAEKEANYHQEHTPAPLAGVK